MFINVLTNLLEFKLRQSIEIIKEHNYSTLLCGGPMRGRRGGRRRPWSLGTGLWRGRVLAGTFRVLILQVATAFVV